MNGSVSIHNINDPLLMHGVECDQLTQELVFTCGQNLISYHNNHQGDTNDQRKVCFPCLKYTHHLYCDKSEGLLKSRIQVDIES